MKPYEKDRFQIEEEKLWDGMMIGEGGYVELAIATWRDFRFAESCYMMCRVSYRMTGKPSSFEEILF